MGTYNPSYTYTYNLLRGLQGAYKCSYHWGYTYPEPPSSRPVGFRVEGLGLRIQGFRMRETLRLLRTFIWGTWARKGFLTQGCWAIFAGYVEPKG